MIIKIIDFGGKIPSRAHYNDAGADVYTQTDVSIEPHTTIPIPLGFGLELPDGYAAFVFPRSGMCKKGIICELPPIDSGYRGEIHAIISNLSDKAITIEKGVCVGQLVIMPVIIPDFSRFCGFAERGSGAFGSTGEK